MASKIHRPEQMRNEIVAWQPPAKGGAGSTPGGVMPGLVRAGQSFLSADARDLERRINEATQAAYHRGLQEGESAGRQMAVQFQTALERLSRTVEDIAGLRPRMRHEAEEDVVKLAVAIARRILYREITVDSGALLGLVRASLDKLDGRELHRIRANAQDAVIIQQHLQQIGLPYKIEVFADPSLARGAAIFETAHGALDASVDTQLNEIERGFADLVRRAQ